MGPIVLFARGIVAQTDTTKRERERERESRARVSARADPKSPWGPPPRPVIEEERFSRSRRGRPLSLCIFHGRFARSECPPRKRGTRPRLCIASLRLALRRLPNPFHGKQNVHVRSSRTRVLERAILALPVAGEYYFQDRLRELCALTRPSPVLQIIIVLSFAFFPLKERY